MHLMPRLFSPKTFASGLEGRTAVCLRCFRSLVRSKLLPRTVSRRIRTTAPNSQHVLAGDQGLASNFFWANRSQRALVDYHEPKGILRAGKHEPQPGDGSHSEHGKRRHVVTPGEPAHRRWKRLKSTVAIQDGGGTTSLPPDASSTLSQTAAAAPAKSFRRHVSTYLALSKPRLAFLVVLTTAASYSAYPMPEILSASSMDIPSLSTMTFLHLTGGTFLTIASANTLNMLFEPAHDAKMSRTRNRPLVRGLVSRRAALAFAIATGVAGATVLWFGVNTTTSLLGAGNLALYAFIYTPMKRIHPINTWVGAIVGAVPPLMGWTAAASQYSTVTSTSTGWDALAQEFKELLFTDQAIGGWLLAALVFAWQFPHFFALSHGVRQEYAGAGYKMLTSSNIPMATRVSLRYSLAMFPICGGLAYYRVTDPSFVVTSGVINAWMLREAVQFWRHQGAHGSARALFWASVWQLPIVLVLAMMQKKGLWDRLYQSVAGELEDDELWDDE